MIYLRIKDKAEIRELLDVIDYYSNHLAEMPELIQQDRYLLLEEISTLSVATGFQRTTAYIIIAQYTHAISRQELCEELEEIVREHLELAEWEDEIPDHNKMLSRLKIEHAPVDVEHLPIEDIYRIASVLANGFNPEMYQRPYDHIYSFPEGNRLISELSSCIVSGVFPFVPKEKAQSLLTTMVNNIRDYFESSGDLQSETELTASYDKINIAYRQIERIFGNLN